MIPSQRGRAAKMQAAVQGFIGHVARNRPPSLWGKGGAKSAADVERVQATKGNDAPNAIGPGKDGQCGIVTIGGTIYWDGRAYQNNGGRYLTSSPLVYPAP